MYRVLSFLIATVFCFCTATAQRSSDQLNRAIVELMKDFKGVAGIYVKNLRTGATISVNADTLFPTASMVKIPILIGIMEKIEKKELTDTTTLFYRDSLHYAGVDILGSFKQNERIELGKLMMLMLTMSDNTASLWLQSLAGKGDRINQLLDSMGFRNTRVNSRTTGREANRMQYGWGQTTPREMAGILEKIVQGKIISPGASTEMIRWLSRNYWDDVALSQIPTGIFVASKNGAVDASRSEVVFVNAPGNPYVFCICTKANEDTSWLESNEAWVMTRKLSKLLWQTYGAKSAEKNGLNLIVR